MSRAGLLVTAAFVLFPAAVVVIDRLAPTPSGPTSSSYATASKGLAAYADLLRRAGHPVERRPRARRPRSAPHAPPRGGGDRPVRARRRAADRRRDEWVGVDRGRARRRALA